MRITVLGMGAMGARMAANIARAGHELTVWNRNPERCDPLVAEGATPASTPREAAEGAELAISMVRDDHASERVWLDGETGALDGLSADAIGLECSTLTIGWARTLARRFADRGRAFLDAPLAGTTPQAEAAQLVFFVGGEPAVFERARPILDAMGSAAHLAGDHGAGAAVKLMVNALFGIQLAAVAELLGLMKRAGLEPARALEIVGATGVCSPAARGAGMAMLAERFAPMFPIDLVEKDFGYVVDSASASAAHVPVANATRSVFAAAKSAGLAGENITAIAKLYS